MGDLKGRARKWLGKARSPFERMQQADVDAANDLRVLRNFIVHRSRQSEQTYEELLLRRKVSSAPLVGEYLRDGNPTRLHQHVEQLRLTAGRLVS